MIIFLWYINYALINNFKIKGAYMATVTKPATQTKSEEKRSEHQNSLGFQKLALLGRRRARKRK